MSYEVYRYIFIGAAILCGVMFVVSVLLFILLKVPKLISDLTGLTAKKAIKNIREHNEATGDKYHKVSAFNEARGKLTDKISPSGQLQRQGQSMKFGIDTSKISTQDLEYEDPGSETTVLSANETSVLEPLVGETSVLAEGSGYGETSVLSPISSGTADGVVDGIFTIEYEIVYIHTNEIIEMEAV